MKGKIVPRPAWGGAWWLLKSSGKQATTFRTKTMKMGIHEKKAGSGYTRRDLDVNTVSTWVTWGGAHIVKENRTFLPI